MAVLVRNPSAATSIVAGWSDITNVYASDDLRASASDTVAVMAAHGFGFTIPAGATIQGIQISVECQGAGNNATRRDLTVSATKNASTAASAEYTIAPTAANVDQVFLIGGSADLLGTTWTAEEINSSSFGVLLSPGVQTGFVREVDHVQITVTYEEIGSEIFTGTTTVNGTASATALGSKSIALATTITGSATVATIAHKIAADWSEWLERSFVTAESGAVPYSNPSVSGSATVSVTGFKQARRTTAIGGLGAANATARKTVAGESQLAGAGVATATGRKLARIEASLIGSATVTTVGRVYSTGISNAFVSGLASVQTHGRKITQSQTSIAAETNIVASVGFKRSISHNLIESTTNVSLFGYKRAFGFAAILGAASISTIGKVYETGKADVFVVGSATVTTQSHKRAADSATPSGIAEANSTIFKRSLTLVDVAGSAQVESTAKVSIFWPRANLTIEGSAEVISLGLKSTRGSVEINADPLAATQSIKVARSSTTVVGSATITTVALNPATAVNFIQFKFTILKPHIAGVVVQPKITATPIAYNERNT